MSGIKKKWTKSTNKEKRDWATVLLPEIAEDIAKTVPRSKLVTPAKVADRYKISLTVARKVLEQLVADGKLVCLIRTNTLRAYGRIAGEDAEEIAEEKAEDAVENKKGKKAAQKPKKQ